MLVDTTVVSEYDDFSPTCENYLFFFCSLASRLMKTSKKKKKKKLHFNCYLEKIICS